MLERTRSISGRRGPATIPGRAAPLVLALGLGLGLMAPGAYADPAGLATPPARIQAAPTVSFDGPVGPTGLVVTPQPAGPQPDPPGLQAVVEQSGVASPRDAASLKGFDPQPEPPATLGTGPVHPGTLRGFNPQPDPPGVTRGVSPQPSPPKAR